MDGGRAEVYKTELLLMITIMIMMMKITVFGTYMAFLILETLINVKTAGHFPLMMAVILKAKETLKHQLFF